VSAVLRLLVAASLVALPAAALDPFEIQVYDGTANAAGEASLELHLNYVARGLRSSVAPELPPDHQAHVTLEPSYGVTSFWELGAYLQGSLRPDGSFDYAGAKLRSKLVTPPGWHEHLRLGINLEVSLLPVAYDRSRWGTEVRPIIAWEDDRWIFAANPNFEMALTSPDRQEGPAFEPGAMAKLKLAGIALGIEYYASLGPVRAFLPAARQQHYLFQTIDVLSWQGVELNAGVGEGLTGASNPVVFKTIVGYAFGR
jgi:hypothetical protein